MRQSAMQQETWREVEERVTAWATENSKSVVSMEELPEPLKEAVKEVLQRVEDEVKAMDGDPNGDNFHALLQTRSYAERLQMFGSILDQECSRLRAKEALKAIFG